eukprot:m.41373 g.41373  ORF g.41373 m.41373 type:complete len:141 (+) comp33148_c0_seq1:304-726(+)
MTCLSLHQPTSLKELAYTKFLLLQDLQQQLVYSLRQQLKAKDKEIQKLQDAICQRTLSLELFTRFDNDDQICFVILLVYRTTGLFASFMTTFLRKLRSTCFTLEQAIVRGHNALVFHLVTAKEGRVFCLNETSVSSFSAV